MNISKDSKITLIKPLDVTELAGDKVMIDFETGKYFMLKGSAVDIWEIIQTPVSVGEILDSLLEMYEVEEETCMKSILTFLAQMYDNKFITID